VSRPVPALETLDAADLRQALLRFRDAVRAHQEELNRLNVYPVPDGDTGTNMALTLESVAGELSSAESMPEVTHAMARGSLMGARGNSGVILSQILRGLADEFAPLEVVGPAAVASGLRRAADAAYQAVLRPVEGTILTVARVSAEAAETGDPSSLVELLDRVDAAANEAVARTPDLLPVLKEAGVVDAGGRGFTLLLDALLEVVDGRPIPEPELVATPAIVAAHLRGDDVADLRFEVMYFLEADDSTIPAFKDAWGAIGDSIVVVGGEGLWNCHIHTNDIGAALEAGIEAGRPRSVRVTDLDAQVEEEEWVRGGSAGAATEVVPHGHVETAIVAVGVGDGVRRLFTSLGVQAIVAGGQSMNPSTSQILEAVEACATDSVVVLPNNKNIVPVARQVDPLTAKTVEVVPTTSVVEALTALVEYDPDAALPENVTTMTRSLERVRSGEVTQAVRASVAECGEIRQGDWIAIARDGILAAAPSAPAAMVALLGHLVDADSEIVTILVGADAHPSDVNKIKQHVALDFPHVEAEFHEGGQPLYPFLVGVE